MTVGEVVSLFRLGQSAQVRRVIGRHLRCVRRCPLREKANFSCLPLVEQHSRMFRHLPLQPFRLGATQFRGAGRCSSVQWEVS